MGRTAFLFPGQGSQHAGMGRELAEALPECREAFAAIDAALDEPISPLCFDGPDEALALTANTQPAILAVSVAAWRALDARGVRPDFAAGHSLGEYSALVAAGVLDAAAAARVVRRRGTYMQEAVPVGRGAMAAVLGLDREGVRALCAEARRDDEVLEPANYNSAGQVVVAGHAAAVDRVVAIASEHGARRALRLPVSAPFHCPLMAPAARRLATDLADLSLGAFAFPVLHDVDARENVDVERVRGALERQVTAPVLWQDIVTRLLELGVDRFVEVGPGRVLSGLVKRAARGAEVVAVGTPAEVEALAGS